MSDDCIFKADLAPHVKYVPLYKIHGTQRYQPSSMCRYTTYTANKDTQPQRWALWHCQNCCISYQTKWPRSSTWAWDRSRTDVGRMYHPFARAKTQTMHNWDCHTWCRIIVIWQVHFFVFWFLKIQETEGKDLTRRSSLLKTWMSHFQLSQDLDESFSKVFKTWMRSDIPFWFSEFERIQET